MHWVTVGTKRYLYRGVRINGKVGRQYLGTGEKAELLYAWDQRRRTAARELKAKIEEQTDAAQLVQALATDFVVWSDLLTKATLITAGYHLHQRIEWRRRRDTEKRQEAQTESQAPTANSAGLCTTRQAG